MLDKFDDSQNMYFTNKFHIAQLRFYNDIKDKVKNQKGIRYKCSKTKTNIHIYSGCSDMCIGFSQII